MFGQIFGLMNGLARPNDHLLKLPQLRFNLKYKFRVHTYTCNIYK